MSTVRRLLKFVKFTRWGLRGRQHYFRIVAGNGEPIAQSEGYKNKADRDSTMRLIMNGAASATIESG